jgi:hypothetical protein
VNNDGFILRKIMTELITENELEVKVRSFKDKSTDRIVVSANQRDEKWVLKISHTQNIENKEYKYLYKIKVRDENKEKGYTSLDKLAKRLKEIGVEVFAIVLSDNQS